jgi:serine protease AprX
MALALAAAASASAQSNNPRRPNQGLRHGKLDDELSRRSTRGGGSRRTRLILQLEDGKALPPNFAQYVKGTRLGLINSYVLEVPDTAIAQVAAHANVRSAHFDRPIWASDYLSTHSTAANVAQQAFGYTGEGVTVAVIDSGITSWHDDLTSTNRRQYPFGNQRVSKFVDFVNGQSLPYDDHGHGSHVAGIILGNGFDSDGKQVGMAPRASLVSLKVLDQDGRGSISTVIAALDWVAANAKAQNIRVVNVSAGAAVTESYWTDPLTLAAKRVVDQGVVVVAAAGNLGMNAKGETQYGGILSPGNAPWVLTVGASSTQGTVPRRDDTLANFSSRGPTRGDYLAKPDLVAPGYGIRSLAVPGSTLYINNAQYLVDGNNRSANAPYLSLSGTSMAAPQVAGAVALMFQANPKLTPNFVKAILQYTAQEFPGYNALQQGAGFLDVLSAVRLAKFYARNKPGAQMPVEPSWSQHIIWGTHLISGGYLNPLGSAWATNVVWGAHDNRLVWGSGCDNCDHVVWRPRDASGRNVVWSTEWDYEGGEDNIVWGTEWDYEGGEDNIVWGTSRGPDDNIVWGTECSCYVCDNFVWCTEWDYEGGEDNIVWGTEWDYEGGEDNIVWGTEWDYEGGEDNIVWGTNAGDHIVWSDASFKQRLWGPNGIFTLNTPAVRREHRQHRRR